MRDGVPKFQAAVLTSSESHRADWTENFFYQLAEVVTREESLFHIHTRTGTITRGAQFAKISQCAPGTSVYWERFGMENPLAPSFVASQHTL